MATDDPIPFPASPAGPPPPSGLELAPGVYAPESALRWHFSRSSGPGGQNVNKVNTKAEFWLPVAKISRLTEAAIARLRQLAGRRLTLADEIHIASDTARTQEVNRRMALDRLRELIVQALHAPKKRRPTKPSRAARQRRLETKKRRSKIKSQRGASGDD